MTILIEQNQRKNHNVFGEVSACPLENTAKVVNTKNTTDDMTLQIAKGAGITFGGLFIRRITNFIFQILLTHILGIAAYGIYTLGYSIMSIVSYVSLFGLPNASIRYGAIYNATGDKSRLKGCFLLTHIASLVIATILGLILFSYSDTFAIEIFKKPELSGVLKGFAFAIPFMTLYLISAASLRGLKKMKHSTAVSEIFPALSNLLIVGLAFLLGFRVLGAVYGFVISSAIAAAIGLYYLLQISESVFSHAKPIYEPKKIFGYSITLLLMNSSYLLLSQTDRIMLGYSTISENVGIYNGSALIAMQLQVFLCALDGIFSPVIADLQSRNQMTQLNSLMKTTAKWVFSLTLPCFMIIIIFPNILRLFGDKFIAGWPVLVILSLAQLVNVSTGSVQAMLIMGGKQKLEFYNSIVLASLNIVLNIFLISKYGILGAAIATGISIALVNISRVIEVYLCFKIHPYKLSFYKPIIAAISAAGIWYIVNIFISLKVYKYTWVGGIAIYIAFYLVILKLLCFDNEDKIILNTIRMRLMKK